MASEPGPDHEGDEGGGGDGGPSTLEWIAAGVGLVLTAALLGQIGWQALQSADDRPPDLVVRVDRIIQASEGWVVEITATNLSPTPAAAVQVEGELRDGDRVLATGQAVLDHLPGHSEEQGGLVLPQDPSGHELRLRVLGYADP